MTPTACGIALHLALHNQGWAGTRPKGAVPCNSLQIETIGHELELRLATCVWFQDQTSAIWTLIE